MKLTFDIDRPAHLYAMGIALGAPQARFESWSAQDQEFLTDCLSGVLPLGTLSPLLQGDKKVALDVCEAAKEQLLSLDGSDGQERWVSRGYLDAVAEASSQDGTPLLVLHHPDDELRLWAADVLGLADALQTRLSSVVALDALGRAYSAAEPPYRPSHARLYREWSTAIWGVTQGAKTHGRVLVQRVNKDAQLPKKERVSDSGYDLTLLYEHKRMGVVTLYGTGIIVEPPDGWYFDVVPRSSIIKRGYILANSVGIIDRSYRGEIFVPLIKLDPDAPDLELPARVAQLIPRPIVHFEISERATLSLTERGAGGFGSTGR